MIYRINTPMPSTRKPERDPQYLKFIRSLFCMVCSRQWGIEAAHFGPHGIGQKASDLDTLPLCHRCHRTGPRSYHQLGERVFCEVHQIDPKRWIELLNAFYEEKLKGRVA